MASVWPYVPLNEIDEDLQWLTSVHKREDDTSRWNVMTARQTFVMRYGFDAYLWEEARQVFKDNIVGEWQLPCWAEASTVTVTSTDTTIAYSVPGEYTIGGKCILWQDCDTYTVLSITDRSGGVLTVPAIGADYTDALLMPLRTCLARQGMSFSRPHSGAYEAEIRFEATDNPDVTTIIEALQVQIALDISPSMDTEVSDGVTRLDVAKSNVASFLSYLESSGGDHEIRIVGFDESATALTSTDYDALRTFVSGLTTGNGTAFDQAFDGASAFFSGTKRRVFIFITDGEPAPISSVSAAVTIRDTISDLEVYGFNIDLTDTQYTDQVDNTGGTQVVDGGGVALRDGMVMSILGLTAYDGKLVFDCSGAVLQPLAGSITRPTIYIDSGFGKVGQEPWRTYDEEEQQISIRESQNRFALKQRLHLLAGQDRPFWFSERVVRVLSSTTTSVTVPRSSAQWVGKLIEIDGDVRTVTSASGAGPQTLNFSAVSAPPTGPVRVLREVRQYTDLVTLQHHRKGGWTALTTVAGTP